LVSSRVPHRSRGDLGTSNVDRIRWSEVIRAACAVARSEFLTAEVFSFIDA
jgi:hypothetical protein